MKTGEKIAAARRELGKEWTQERLLNELKRHGVERKIGWLMNVETDRVQHLSVEYVRALSKVLKKPLDYFKDDEPVASPNDALKGGIDYLMGEVLSLKIRVEALERKK